ncbi:hypothetical protein CLV80_104138 [Yoonia maritima]|uniref:O-antigen/teichoic acid export membrane protein n=2 Tax=Yoonia maritima TaxID=1435347 RepID=A0A2T0W075_9RHOB|nr:hypothetical protein CLV80_104138 [Yoonia maritima]
MVRSFMVTTQISKIITMQALGPMVLRGAIVGINFAVMIGLATVLGLAAFGELALIWGAALVAAPIISVGAPLLMLRALTDGDGMSVKAVMLQVIIVPAALAVLSGTVAIAIWPTLPWFSILLCAFWINFASCLASAMRALGSVNLSMALRDCGPQIALAIAAMFMRDGQILVLAAFCIGCIALPLSIWAFRSADRLNIIGRHHASPVPSVSLWGTSVLGVGLAQIDIIVGGALLSPTQIGLYAVLRRVANLVALPVSVATWVSANDVSKSYGAGDTIMLQRASRGGSQIAFFAGLILFLCGLCSLAWVAPDGQFVFFILLCCAFIQVVFASGLTVATLCGLAKFAALTRGFSILVYSGCAAFVVGPVSNAGAYLLATSLGSLALWAIVRQQRHIDTSAWSLRSRPEAQWKPS